MYEFNVNSTLHYFEINTPNDTKSFGNKANQTLKIGALFLKSSANKKSPLVVFSHGRNGNVFSSKLDLLVIEELVKNGFNVVFLLHQDSKFTSFSEHFDEPAELSFRAYSTIKLINYLHNSDLNSLIDFDNIYGVGKSLGTATLLIAQGAKFHSDNGYIGFNERIKFKSLVGIVPFVGNNDVEIFKETLEDMNINSSFLSICGDNDTIAPIEFIKRIKDKNLKIEVMQNEEHHLSEVVHKEVVSKVINFFTHH